MTPFEDAVLKEGYTGSLNFENIGENEGIWVRGFFKAPRTGTYNFWAAADDTVDIWMNTSPNVVTTGTYIIFKFFTLENNCKKLSSVNVDMIIETNISSPGREIVILLVVKTYLFLQAATIGWKYFRKTAEDRVTYRSQ